MRKGKAIVAVVVGVALVIPNPISKIAYAGVGQVMGWFTSSDHVDNKFKTSNIDINISENFEAPKNWTGQNTTKEAWVENKNGTSELVRVAIVPKWEDSMGQQFLGNVNYVTINYSNDPAWINGGDGYYYYNKLLNNGERTPDIITSVSANIPDGEKDLYKGKTLVVDVKSETVQPTVDAYKAVWRSVPQNVQNILNGLCK